MKKTVKVRLVAGLIAASAIGCVHHTYTTRTAGGVVYVTREPPAERVEVISTSPGTNFVWVRGHWGWTGSDFDWIPGRWVVPSSGFTAWVPGHWQHDNHGWFWIDGHWR